MRLPPPTIALVENDPATNQAFARLLRAHGYVVTIFYSAESYLAHKDTEAIDCILLDVNLDGMSGLELQRQIRLMLCEVPIVFMTRRHDVNVELYGRRHGCSGFLYKPFNSQEMTKAIEYALDGAGINLHQYEKI